MPRYDDIWDTLVRRAVDQGAIDVRTMMERAFQMGMTEEALATRLDADLDDDGSVFGKFLRSIADASGTSVVAAVRQGELVGHLSDDQELARLTGLSEVDDIIDAAKAGADPELAQTLENAVADNYEETWVCTFVKTCNRCLPLHGVTLLHSEWAERGLLPEVMHDGWSSSCKCRLVYAGFVRGRKSLTAPLVRTGQPPLTSARGFRAQKKTLRSVLQNDIDKSLAARDKALATKDGRRTLRIAGQLRTLQSGDDDE